MRSRAVLCWTSRRSRPGPRPPRRVTRASSRATTGVGRGGSGRTPPPTSSTASLAHRQRVTSPTAAGGRGPGASAACRGIGRAPRRGHLGRRCVAEPRPSRHRRRAPSPAERDRAPVDERVGERPVHEARAPHPPLRRLGVPVGVTSGLVEAIGPRRLRRLPTSGARRRRRAPSPSRRSPSCPAGTGPVARSNQPLVSMP